MLLDIVRTLLFIDRIDKSNKAPLEKIIDGHQFEFPVNHLEWFIVNVD